MPSYADFNGDHCAYQRAWRATNADWKNNFRDIRQQIKFESFIHYEPMSGCWLWAGSMNQRDGTAIFAIKSVCKKASHVSLWHFRRVEVPSGMMACHKCCTPLCVNPDHLYVGTLLDNNHDRWKDGHYAKGSLHFRSKLTEEIVQEMRRLRAKGFSFRTLGDTFGVAKKVAREAVIGRTWKHVA